MKEPPLRIRSETMLKSSESRLSLDLWNLRAGVSSAIFDRPMGPLSHANPHANHRSPSAASFSFSLLAAFAVAPGAGWGDPKAKRYDFEWGKAGRRIRGLVNGKPAWGDFERLIHLPSSNVPRRLLIDPVRRFPVPSCPDRTDPCRSVCCVASSAACAQKKYRNLFDM